MSGKISSVGIALAVGLVAGACSAGAQPTPAAVPATPTAAAATMVAPTQAATDELTPSLPPTPSLAPTPSAEPTVARLSGGAGQAGTYRLTAAHPHIYLTLDDGWSVYFDEGGGTYMSLGDGELLVGRPDAVIVPDTHDHEATPEDLLAWLVDHPSLNATAPTPVEISGMDAAYVEVDPTHSVDVFYDPLGNFHVGPGKMARFYVVPWEGNDIFIALLRTEVGTLDDAIEVGVPVVDSLEIVEE